MVGVHGRTHSLACTLFFLVLACATPPQASPADPSASAEDVLAGIEDPATLSELLQWSLKHQDLDALHKRAEAIRQGGGEAASTDALPGDTLPSPADASTSTAELPQRLTAERRVELDALANSLMPNTAVLATNALEQAVDVSLAVEDREESLLNLQDLVEDLDTARDFKSIGGFPQVVGLLSSDSAPLQAAAAYVLGSAVKNQHELQLQLLAEPGALSALLVLLRSHVDEEVRAKALYALSATLQHCPEAQAAFTATDGVEALLEALSDGSQPRLVRKALALVADLLREQLPATDDFEASPLQVEGLPLRGLWGNASALCNAVVNSLQRAQDVDAQEKAVLALEQLMRARLLAGVALASDDSECSARELRSALQGYISRCEGALNEAADAAGSCDELLGVGKQLHASLPTTVAAPA